MVSQIMSLSAPNNLTHLHSNPTNEPCTPAQFDLSPTQLDAKPQLSLTDSTSQPLSTQAKQPENPRITMRRLSEQGVDLSYQFERERLIKEKYKETDVFWYFGFGSNMCKSNLENKRVPVYESEAALLRGWKLVFDLATSSILEPSYANIRYTGSISDCVHGVLHAMHKTALEMMDQIEGGGMTYRRTPTTVRTYEGHLVNASAYICTSDNPAALILKEIPPSRRYLDVLIEGAKSFNLDIDYIRWLEQHPFTDYPELKWTEEQLTAIESRRFTVEELAQYSWKESGGKKQTIYMAVKGIVFECSDLKFPIFYLKLLSGRDSTLFLAGRVAMRDCPIPKSIEEFNDCHKRYINGNLADFASRHRIIGHTVERDLYNW